MARRKWNLYEGVLYAVDLTAAVAGLFLAALVRQGLPLGRPFQAMGGPGLPVYLLTVVVWTVAFRRLGAYDLNRNWRTEDEVQTVVVAIAASTILLAGTLYLTYRGLSRLLFGYFMVIVTVLTLLLRRGARRLLQWRRWDVAATQRVLVIGAGEIGQQVGRALKDRQWMGLQLIGFLDKAAGSPGEASMTVPLVGSLEDAERVITEQAIDEVIVTLSLDDHRRTEDLLKRLVEMPVNVRVIPDFVPLAYLRSSVGVLGGLPFVTLKEPVLNGTALVTKRALDLLVASAMLLVLWPLMLLIAVAVRLDSPGPALFRQERIGWNGQRFAILKFRTMREDADLDVDSITARAENGQSYLRKAPSDPRVTRLGRSLRRWSLDELPQLFNVLKGEMSMVGPRPELPRLVQDYQPWQYKRLAVPPGLTGWWQVTGRSDNPSSLNVDADLYYIANYSLWLDLQILARTLGAVLSGKGAY